MTDSKSKAHSIVHRVAQQIRSIAIATPPGEYIGSEERFTRQFNITGPTLRQAIRLLEHEDVVRVKRGVHGGYFAHRPDAKAVSRLSATYLRSNMEDIDELSIVIDHIMPLLIDLAIKSERLVEFEWYAEPANAARTYKDFISQQRSFIDLLWEISNNAPLKLFYAIAYNLGDGIELEPITEMTPAMIELQRNRTDLAKALLAKDAKLAVELALMMTRVVHGGIKQNLKKLGKRV